MNVYEMEGFLRGKCMPRDILVNESTAEYLVRKLNEATVVNAERDALYSQEYVSALLAELEKAQRANNSAPTILRQLAEEKQKRGEVAAATAFNYAASALQKELSK
ncbi:Uncharacterised protein [Serratia liquefaciens]|uniref:hypothetical protein n=1 Tax=Serratia liquefaciens TaxID=614 RepID=UPI0021781A0E|nr:hypothetical protein [Serratia liquefaciens]CAI1701156.1 Uncharacterised protein [Serratia liquefaciens]HDS8357440.1 hypothetical protein [Serratia liquefaciens]